MKDLNWSLEHIKKRSYFYSRNFFIRTTQSILYCSFILYLVFIIRVVVNRNSNEKNFHV